MVSLAEGSAGALALTVAVASAACADPTDPRPEPAECYAEPTRCIDPGGAHYQYVVDRIWLAPSAEEAMAHSFDIDGDPEGRPDNRFASLLAGLSQQREDIFLGEQLPTGDAIILLDLQAGDLADADGVGLRVLFGRDPVPAPCAGPDDPVCGRHLDGGGRFAVAADSPADAVMAGFLSGGEFAGGPGRAAFSIAVDGVEPARFELVGARARVVVTPDGLVGSIGGGLRESDGSAVVMSFVLEAARRAVAADCPGAAPPTCACADGSTGDLYMDLFDQDGDCAIDAWELRASCDLGCFDDPDVDLLDADGAFDPRTDGYLDALSFGVEFSAVAAQFER